MAIYYVSKQGSDANNGLGPDASHASNKPWLTLGKLLGAAGFASSDTAYIGPGVYRETVTVAMTSATAETKVYGDPRNTQGFKTSGGVLVGAEPVRWTAWTTDDKTTPAATALLSLAGRDFLTLQDIWMYGSSAGINVIQSTTTGASTNITLRRCLIFSPSGSTVNRCIQINATGSPAGTTLTWLVEQCVLVCYGGGSSPVQITPTSSGSADFDIDVKFNNCLCLFQSGGFSIQKSGASAFLGGGLKIANCTIICGTALTVVTASSTTYQNTVYNCNLITSSTALVGVTVSAPRDIVEDCNQINANTARTNVDAGANTVTSYATLFQLGQQQLWGFNPRMPFSPTFDSPQLGFGASGPTLTTDMLGRDRPSGCGITWANTSKAVGCLEYHDFAVKETSTVDSTPGIVLTGPGDHMVEVAVPDAATVITVKVCYDANHGTGSKPQAELLADARVGVSGEIKTATNSSGTSFETLTFSSITPTSKCKVKILLRSRAAAGNGKAFFDTVAAT